MPHLSLPSPRLSGLSLPAIVALGAAWVCGAAPVAVAQTIVYRPIVTGFAPAAGPYVANYTPAGNYAAVTAFSPPVMTLAPMAAVSPPLTTIVPSSSGAVTSYSLPAMTTAGPQLSFSSRLCCGVTHGCTLAMSRRAWPLRASPRDSSSKSSGYLA